MKGFREDERGSATIEMAVLMPMILILMILLIYLALYLYDRSVLYGDAYLAAFIASEQPEEDNETLYAEADACFSALQEGQLIALSKVLYELTVDADGVEISYSGEVAVPVMEGSTVFREWESYVFSDSAYAARHRPVTFIRRCRILERMLSQEEEPEAGGEQ